MKIRIGTRKSQLAITQAKIVARILEEGGMETELVTVSTKGDQYQNIPIDKVGKNGVFVGELESALTSGFVDVAVHSLKDMSSVLPEGYLLAPPPKAPDVRDVIVAKTPLQREDDLHNMVIATGSNRRKAQLLHFYPHATTVPIRGNIQTRIEKMMASKADGTILAYAGLERSGLTHCISCILDPTRFIPSPSQGLLGVEISEKRTDLLEIFEEASDPYAHFRMKVERKYQKALDASCHSPIGIYIEKINSTDIQLHGCFAKSARDPLRYASIPSTFTTAEEDVLKLVREVKNRD